MALGNMSAPGFLVLEIPWLRRATYTKPAMVIVTSSRRPGFLTVGVTYDDGNPDVHAAACDYGGVLQQMILNTFISETMNGAEVIDRLRAQVEARMNVVNWHYIDYHRGPIGVFEFDEGYLLFINGLWHWANAMISGLRDVLLYRNRRLEAAVTDIPTIHDRERRLSFWSAGRISQKQFASYWQTAVDSIERYMGSPNRNRNMSLLEWGFPYIEALKKGAARVLEQPSEDVKQEIDFQMPRGIP